MEFRGFKAGSFCIFFAERLTLTIEIPIDVFPLLLINNFGFKRPAAKLFDARSCK